MENKIVELSPSIVGLTACSSPGAQPKYYDSLEKAWYKRNYTGYEGKAEHLSSLVLSCSNVKDYVYYEECKINGKAGCVSNNFLKENEAFISFQRLYEMFEGQELQEKMAILSGPEERITYVKNFIKETTNLDCSEYLSNTLALDYLIMNPDRHFNNLGVIVNHDTDSYRMAPIFDNGAGLLSDFNKFPIYEDLEVNKENVCGLPFSSSLGLQAKTAGINLKIDYEKLNGLLDKEPDSRAKEILKDRLKELEYLFYNEKTKEILNEEIER